jgi:cyclopropane-fatty-acyl-phospholipid synthase
MNNSIIQKYFQSILDKVGITINGPQPEDIKIIDERALKRIMRDGSLGFGESYMAGWWDCERIDELSYRLCAAALDTSIKTNLLQSLYNWSTSIINYQSKRRSKEVAHKHYNLDNHLFELMLGESMAYSCAYWKDATDLNAAQFAKYDLICKKLYLTSEDSLLDIGCGWGGLAAYAAEHYGCRVVGISIASEQINYAKEKFKHLPIDFYVADYRDPNCYNPKQIKFSKLVSVGAFEHIGHKNHYSFLKLMESQLSDKGLFLLHTIGSNETITATDPWINKYIFPNGNVPSTVQIAQAMEKQFIVEDWHNFGPYYEKTLLAWHENFEKHWSSLEQHYDREFYRMWRYYLLTCAGMFRARSAQLWQIVMSKPGGVDSYESVR